MEFVNPAPFLNRIVYTHFHEPIGGYAFHTFDQNELSLKRCEVKV